MGWLQHVEGTWEAGWRCLGDRENPKNNFDRIRENKEKNNETIYMIRNPLDFPAMFSQKPSHFDYLYSYATHRVPAEETQTDKNHGRKTRISPWDWFEKGRFGQRNFL